MYSRELSSQGFANLSFMKLPYKNNYDTSAHLITVKKEFEGRAII